MFHCNGWCFPWAVTGAGRAPRAAAQGRPAARVAGCSSEEGVTHLQRRADRADHADQRSRGTGGTAGAPAAHRHRRRPAVAHAAGAVGGDRRRADAPLRPDRDLRPAHHLRLAPGMGRARDAEGRARLRARQGVPHLVACELRVVDADMQRRPRRRRHDGRGGDARQQRDGRLLRRPRRHGARRSAAAGSIRATSP